MCTGTLAHQTEGLLQGQFAAEGLTGIGCFATPNGACYEGQVCSTGSCMLVQYELTWQSSKVPLGQCHMQAAATTEPQLTCIVLHR